MQLRNLFMKIIKIALSTICLLSSFFALANENASDPTASLSFTDIKVQFFDTGAPLGDQRDRYAIEGAYTFTPKHKVTYEVNYWETDITGQTESGMESIRAKYINLSPGMLESGLKYKFAWGIEALTSISDVEKGIGTGTTQIAPLVGAGWVLSPNDTLITLVQYFHSIDEDVNANKVRLTGPRMIWIHSMPKYKAWIKIDDKFAINHEKDGASSNLLEVQVGKMFTPTIGAYFELLYGTGGDRLYESGLGLGVRISY